MRLIAADRHAMAAQVFVTAEGVQHTARNIRPMVDEDIELRDRAAEALLTERHFVQKDEDVDDDDRDVHVRKRARFLAVENGNHASRGRSNPSMGTAPMLLRSRTSPATR